jgi:hypothetical protein
MVLRPGMTQDLKGEPIGLLNQTKIDFIGLIALHFISFVLLPTSQSNIWLTHFYLLYKMVPYPIVQCNRMQILI